MVFLPHRSDSNVCFNVQLDGVTINEVKSCRYLDLIIDDELKWTEHIGHIPSFVEVCRIMVRGLSPTKMEPSLIAYS